MKKQQSPSFIVLLNPLAGLLMLVGFLIRHIVSQPVSYGINCLALWVLTLSSYSTQKTGGILFMHKAALNSRLNYWFYRVILVLTLVYSLILVIDLVRNIL